MYPSFGDIKFMYEIGGYTDDDILEYVSFDWLTQAQADEIMGKTVHELETMAKSVLIDSLTEEKEILPLELTEK